MVVNQSTTENEIYNLLGHEQVESWTQEKVSLWLEEKDWQQFASTFEKHNICKERFFQITLAELVHYLPRTMTTYYERRRLLNEIRLLVPCHGKPTPTTPTNISINTNLGAIRGVATPPPSLDNHRSSGIGYLSAGSSCSASSSPCSLKQSSPTRPSSYSPKAAFHKIKNSFQKTTPRTTPENKISKFLANYATTHYWSKSSLPEQPAAKPIVEQRIQITGDKETWYSLNVTHMRDPVAIKKHILQRMQYDDCDDQYQYFHENGLDPDMPMDPHELMYLCSIADPSASQRILVIKKPCTMHPELGLSPTNYYRPLLSRKQQAMKRLPKLPPPTGGVQLSDPPIGLWAIAPQPPQLWAVTPEFWGERPPAQVVFQHMERYFDSQDLDKQVQITHTQTTTKSIRIVAREASRKYATVQRRKSTKIWGPLPCINEQMRLHTTQWIRGKLIGKGSFGRVYLAFHVGTGEVIAVKQVETTLDHHHQHDMVASLYQEIMLLRDLDHENIVQYLGYGHDEGVIHIFLEYVSGGSIASRLALHGALDETLTSYFTRQICSGLAYLHSKHILHRDIKAANILVESDGVCKISDFGLSKKNDYDEVYDQNSNMSSLRGSIYWMAPEVVKNEPYSAKVDIWSLGCTVIEMLTGQRPWLSMNQLAALYHLGRLNSPTLPDHISDCAKDFLKQCFIIDPSKRPTATDLLNHPFLLNLNCFQFKDYIDKGKI